jgi:hypothetical protein
VTDQGYSSILLATQASVEKFPAIDAPAGPIHARHEAYKTSVRTAPPRSADR